MNRSRLLRHKLHYRMVVTLTSGDTYDGLYTGSDRVVMMLAQASLIGTEGQAIERARVDGVLYLPWDRVAYLQTP